MSEPRSGALDRAVHRFRYRDAGAWLGEFLGFVILGGRALHGTFSIGSFSSCIWLVGVVLAGGNGVFVALRSWRGLTLDGDGITWHRAQLFIPWPQVTELDVDTDLKGTGKPRLIVHTADATEALYGQRGMARMAIQSNVHRFGGPVALKAHLLTVPAETIIAVADRLREAPAPPDDPRRHARRLRALRVANLWALAGFAGLIAGLATIVV
ncbi:hypothetical protein [Actinomadura luteofluorescens]|uniref:hypothetical protein n=1 Tax=Actinomadura luteofluorescens TaxID=46163 RepID=UPI003D8F2CD9